MEKEIPWVIPEPTKIKHEILLGYIGKWMGILLNTQKKYGHPEAMLYFDGFSGPGVYWSDEQKITQVPGSPILVAQLANSYLDGKPEREILILGIDKRQDCVDMLNEKFLEINSHKQHWEAHLGEFEDAINSLFDTIEEDLTYIPPMFIFIDPFGYSGFSMKTLERLLSYERVELLITFMIYDIARFYMTEEHEDRMLALYGNFDFRGALTVTSPEKKQLFLKNLYCQKLKQVAGAEFVMPFRVNTPGQGRRPRYYLIHASKHFVALKNMKDTMFTVSKSSYRFEAVGLVPEQLGMFEDPEKIVLSERILEKCKSVHPKSLLYEDIEKWAYIETNGVSKTIAASLLELEEENQLIIKRKPRQHENKVKPGATILYNLE